MQQTVATEKYHELERPEDSRMVTAGVVTVGLGSSGC